MVSLSCLKCVKGSHRRLLLQIDPTLILLPWIVGPFIVGDYWSLVVVLLLLAGRMFYLDDALQESFYTQIVLEQTSNVEDKRDGGKLRRQESNAGISESIYESYAPPELMSVIVGLGFYVFGVKGLVLGPLIVSSVFVLGQLLQSIHEHEEEDTITPGTASSEGHSIIREK